MPAELTDEQIIQIVAEGLKEKDEEKIGLFNELFHRHSPLIFNLCLNIVKNKADADDLLQEVFLKALKNAGKFRHSSSVKTWLYAIAKNSSISRYTKQKRTWFMPIEIKKEGKDNEFTQELPDKTLDIEKQVEKMHIGSHLRECLETLDTDSRVILSLYMEKLAYKEMSEILKCPINTVSSRIFRALDKLRILMCERGYNA